ncbi:hypothetical protein ROZALSC1DRAFT_24333, partial [Rozella allomycis CSF55]
NECIANGRIGSVVRGNLWGHENVIFKLKDLTKESWKGKELKNEVSVYKKLENLQGKAIPNFIAYVKIWDMFMGIVISDCGQQTEEGEFVSLKQDCLRQFHDQGLIHGDVCNRNFVKNSENKCNWSRAGDNTIVNIFLGGKIQQSIIVRLIIMDEGSTSSNRLTLKTPENSETWMGLEPYGLPQH